MDSVITMGTCSLARHMDHWEKAGQGYPLVVWQAERHCARQEKQQGAKKCDRSKLGTFEGPEEDRGGGGGDVTRKGAGSCWLLEATMNSKVARASRNQYLPDVVFHVYMKMPCPQKNPEP